MPRINQILKDLYKLDPEFKKHEKELKKLLSQLVKATPEIVLDQAFVDSLRESLKQKASGMSTVRAGGWLRYFSYTFGGAAATALVFVLVLNGVPMGESLFSTQINQVAGQGFNLSSGDAASGSTISARPQSGGGGAGGGGGFSEMSMDSKMMAPDYVPVQYKYVYSGPLPLIPDGEAAIYKRIRDKASDGAIVRALTGFDFGIINLGDFKNLAVEYMSMLEDRPYGYQVYVSLTDNTININQNWSKWPNPYNDCQDDQACYDRLRLKPSDVLPDETLIGIANDFLADYQVDASEYGAPYIQQQFQPIMYADATAEVYIPEYMTVTYPELIDGSVVTETDGNKSGLNVTVSLRDKRVSSMYNLRPRQYDRSIYPSETNPVSILDWASRGGIYGDYYDASIKTVDVLLEAPTVSHFKYYVYLPKEGRSEEYLIPAYVFPIQKPQDYTGYRSYVVVPAVKDFEGLTSVPVAVPLMTK